MRLQSYFRDNRQTEGPRMYSFPELGLARKPRRFRVFARRKTLLRSIPSTPVRLPSETGILDLPTVSRIKSPRSRLWIEGVSTRTRLGAGTFTAVRLTPREF